MSATSNYKIYKIFYDGVLKEEISAKNKKSVKEYIRDEYKNRWHSSINYKYFKLKLFKIEIV